MAQTMTRHRGLRARIRSKYQRSTVHSYYFCKADTEITNMIYELETIISGFIPWVEDEDSTDLEIEGLRKYYIAVQASIDSQYALSIDYEDGLNKLRNDGTPSNGHLAQGPNERE